MKKIKLAETLNKIKKIFTFLLFGILINSCSTEDNPENNNDKNLITNIKFDLNHSIPVDLKFEYDNQKRLVKKIGTIGNLSGIFVGYFSKDVYTSLIYNDNKVTVEEFPLLPNYIVFKNTNYYTLNSKNQITIREIPDSNHNDRYKKILYEYANNKLVEIKTTFPNRLYDINKPFYSYILTYSEKFYYNTNGNLAKTEYYEQHDGINTGEKTIRTFEDYDTSYNPTKKIFLLEEYFYRSLSKNNFRKYTENKYHLDSILYGFTEQKWSYTYDSSGNIVVN